MSKSKTLAIAVLVIILLVYNVVVFVIPFERSQPFWVAYTFTTLAFFLQIGVCSVAWGEADTMRSRFLGLPILYVGFTYLITQLVVGAIFMSIPETPSWITIVVSVIILGVSAVSLIVTEAGRDEIVRVEERVQRKVAYIKSLQVEVELLASQATNEAVKKELRALLEAVKYSDPMSSDSLASLEARIAGKISELKNDALSAHPESVRIIAQQMMKLLEERNLRTKALKNS